MIRVSELVARAAGPAVALGPVSFELAAGGTYCLVGGPLDGVPLLLAVLAGSTVPRSGAVIVSGQPPGPRATLAYVPLAPDLPRGLEVGEYLRLAATVRGEPATSPDERLAVLGVETLTRRRVERLRLEEARAVALVEALTSRAEVLLLEEPLVDLDPRAMGLLRTALESRRGKVTTVVGSASPADARELGGEQLYFERGKLRHRAVEEDAWAAMTSVAPRLEVRCEAARELLTALATGSTFTEVESVGSRLTLRGDNALEMATAVALAAREKRATLDLVEFVDPRGVA